MASYQEVNITHDLRGEIILDYHKDITYIVDGEEVYHLQIIFPINPKNEIEKKYPCIVYMMSTNERNDDIYHKIPRLSQFAQRGFVVALIEPPINTSTYEVKTVMLQNAVQYLTANAACYNIEPQNMFIWRDATHEDNNLAVDFDHFVTTHTEFHTTVKAIVSFGGKEQMNMLYAKLTAEIPPMLMIPCEVKKTLNLEFWTEDVFDVIEDFLSNYIN